MMALKQIQTLPSLAIKYRDAQSAQIDLVVEQASARWKLMGPRFDSSWSLMAGAITAAVIDAQREMIERAEVYVPALMADSGQVAVDSPLARPRTGGLAGVTHDGMPVESALGFVTVKAKQAVGAGKSPRMALWSSGLWMAASINTMLADTARGAEQLQSSVYPTGGFVRVVNGSACIRCVVLAGKWFRWNDGFERHPQCRCLHVPAGQAMGGDWVTDPYGLFNSLDEAGQIKLMGSVSDAQAIRDGADIFQVANARTGLSKSGRFTSYGTHKTSFAAKRMPAGYKRLTPGTIYERSVTGNWSRERTLAELEKYGYITGRGQVGTGVIRGQREGFGAMGRGGTRKAASQAHLEMQRTGVRDPHNRYTMTTAERRFNDVQRRYEYALSGRHPYSSPGFGSTPDPYGLRLNNQGVYAPKLTPAALRQAKADYEFYREAYPALVKRFGPLNSFRVPQ